MIKIYGMKTCKDCIYLFDQLKGREQEFTYIEVGEHVKLLKEFLVIRDKEPVFDECKEKGSAGIPCFVREDGTVTLTPEDVGLISRPEDWEEGCCTDEPEPETPGEETLETDEYVTFEIIGRDGKKHEMAVVDEFDFEKDHYVVAAEVVDDTIREEGRFIYKSIIKGDDFTVEEIRKAFDYKRIAQAYMEME